MSFEKVNEVPFTLRRKQRSTLGQYWATMGFIFQILRDIHPNLKLTIDTMTLIGIIWSIRTGLNLFATLCSGIRTHLWSRVWSLNLKAKYGEWVVISGATDGIGLEYGREFARRGHSLILIGRSEDKLNKVKQELSRLINPSKIVTILQDLNTADSQAYADLASQVRGNSGTPRDIGILINNAGVMHESPNRFLDQDEEGLWSHVRVNIAATLMITRAVLPLLISKRRGLVINVSSIAAYRPLPLMGVYSASKKFIDYFSQTLEYEYKSYNIDVQNVTPSYIATKMTKWSNALQNVNVMTPDAGSFAKNAVATIGRANQTTGYWAHGLQWFMYEWMTPDWLWSLSSWHLLKNIDSSNKAK